MGSQTKNISGQGTIELMIVLTLILFILFSSYKVSDFVRQNFKHQYIEKKMVNLDYDVSLGNGILRFESIKNVERLENQGWVVMQQWKEGTLLSKDAQRIYIFKNLGVIYE